MRMVQLIDEGKPETAFEIESASSRFPHTLVDAQGAVYFDMATATAKSRRAVLAHAQPGDRILRTNGREYFSAALLRRHVPRVALASFDEMVETRREQAGYTRTTPERKPGFLERLRLRRRARLGSSEYRSR